MELLNLLTGDQLSSGLIPSERKRSEGVTNNWCSKLTIQSPLGVTKEYQSMNLVLRLLTVELYLNPAIMRTTQTCQ